MKSALIYPKRVSIIVVLSLLLAQSLGTDALECYRNSALGVDIEQKVCDPVFQPYCVKANVYDGTVSRDCASAKQCPQGNACVPITYTEDGTTDFVCCCNTNLCNSALASAMLSPTFIYTIIGLLVICRTLLY